MLLLFFIFTAEIMQARLALSLPELMENWAIYFLLGLYFLQFIFAPFQGGFSDHYCRRKSLAFGFFMIGISELFLYISDRQPGLFLTLSIIIFGMLGNVDVIAKAALLDTRFGKNRRVALGSAFISQAIAWIAVAITIKLFPDLRISLTALGCSFVSILLSFFVFEDKRDLPHWRETFSLKKESMALLGFLKNKTYSVGFLAFFFTQIAFFIAYLFPDIFFTRELEWKYVIYFTTGFAFGLIFQMCGRFTDKQGIVWGIIISLGSILIGWFINSLGYEKNYLDLGFNCFLFMFGLGIFLPCMYALYSKAHQLHEQGKLFGLLFSIQSGGQITATILLLLWRTATPIAIQAIVAIVFYTSFVLYQKRLRNSVS
ncbi:MAG: MFS transporter [Chlamydiae bacterium]|nr:MFS transporter [Chlamydiota bacterium]